MAVPKGLQTLYEYNLSHQGLKHQIPNCKEAKAPPKLLGLTFSSFDGKPSSWQKVKVLTSQQNAPVVNLPLTLLAQLSSFARPSLHLCHLALASPLKHTPRFAWNPRARVPGKPPHETIPNGLSGGFHAKLHPSDIACGHRQGSTPRVLARLLSPVQLAVQPIGMS